MARGRYVREAERDFGLPNLWVGASFFWRHARGLVAALKASNHLSATQQYCPARFGQSDRDWWFLLAAGLPCFAPLDRLASSSLGTCHRRTLRLHWRARQLSERCKTLGANARWRALDRAKAQPGLTKFQLPGQLMQHPRSLLEASFQSETNARNGVQCCIPILCRVQHARSITL